MRTPPDLALLLRGATIANTPLELEGILQSVFNPAWLRSILAQVADAPNRSELAHNSFVHANGFIRLTLGQIDEIGGRARLHIWRSRATDAHIHNHSWHFASAIVIGGLVSTDYTIREDQSGRYRMFSIPGRAGVRSGLHNARRSGKWSAIQKRRTMFHPGQIYSREAQEFHRAESVDGDFCVTLVLQGRHITPVSLIVSEFDDIRSEPVRLPIEDFVDELARVTAALL